MKGTAMKTRPIGKLSASVVGLGCNHFGMRINFEQSAAVVDAALDEASRCSILRISTARRKAKSSSGVQSVRAALTSSSAPSSGWRLTRNRQGAKPDYVRRAVEDKRMCSNEQVMAVASPPDGDH
jgi:hypothetical protein